MPFTRVGSKIKSWNITLYSWTVYIARELSGLEGTLASLGKCMSEGRGLHAIFSTIQHEPSSSAHYDDASTSLLGPERLRSVGLPKSPQPNPSVLSVESVLESFDGNSAANMPGQGLSRPGNQQFPVVDLGHGAFIGISLRLGLSMRCTTEHIACQNKAKIGISNSSVHSGLCTNWQNWFSITVF